MGIAEIFSGFCSNILIDTDTRSSISQRYRSITKRLNTDFRDSDSDTYFSRYVGSYWRWTAIRWISDLDMIFILPDNLFSQYNNYSWNGQSALLQAIRTSIQKTYPSTRISADWQIVEINFTDNITFQIVPVFWNNEEWFLYPDTNDWWSRKLTKPIQEINEINSMDKICNYNLKKLCEMMRVWKKERNVEISWLLIDTLAYNFLSSWQYKDKSYVYYDWMVRDLLLDLSVQDKDKKYWLAPWSKQQVYRTWLFEAKAKKCYNLACEAIEAMSKKYEYTAEEKRKEIFWSIFSS